ncbi:hypothetical protein, partial [Fimbriiglobus ruber]
QPAWPTPSERSTSAGTPLRHKQIEAWLGSSIAQEISENAENVKIKRNEGERAIIRDMVGRLATIVAVTNQELRYEAITISSSSPELVAEFQAAIFRDSEPIHVKDFYTRAASAMRNWLIERLAHLEASDKPIQRQITAWKAYHRAAGKLPSSLRAVNDLIVYFGWDQVKAAEILAISPVDISKRYTASLVITNPFLEKARGRS